MHRVPKSMSMHFFVSLLYWKPLLNYSCRSKFSVGLDMAQAVSRRLLTTEMRLQFQASQCGICGGQSGSGNGFSSSTSDFSFQCYSTNALYLFFHLPPTLCNVFLPALQFLLSVSFHQCSILIHSTTTDAV